MIHKNYRTYNKTFKNTHSKNKQREIMSWEIILFKVLFQAQILKIMGSYFLLII